MRFATIIASTFLAALSVSAQNATVTTTIVSGTAPLTPAQSTQAACLKACPIDDDTCRTKCIPLGSQTNAIADCITACPKGNGTATDNANYESCVTGCISKGGATATAVPTESAAASASGAASTAAAGAGSTASGAGASATGTATGSSASASATKSGAAENVRMGASFVGAMGLFAAIFAL